VHDLERSQVVAFLRSQELFISENDEERVLKTSSVLGNNIHALSNLATVIRHNNTLLEMGWNFVGEISNLKDVLGKGIRRLGNSLNTHYDDRHISLVASFDFMFNKLSPVLQNVLVMMLLIPSGHFMELNELADMCAASLPNASTEFCENEYLETNFIDLVHYNLLVSRTFVENCITFSLKPLERFSLQVKALMNTEFADAITSFYNEKTLVYLVSPNKVGTYNLTTIDKDVRGYVNNIYTLLPDGKHIKTISDVFVQTAVNMKNCTELCDYANVGLNVVTSSGFRLNMQELSSIISTLNEALTYYSNNISLECYMRMRFLSVKLSDEIRKFDSEIKASDAYVNHLLQILNFAKERRVTETAVVADVYYEICYEYGSTDSSDDPTFISQYQSYLKDAIKLFIGLNTRVRPDSFFFKLGFIYEELGKSVMLSNKGCEALNYFSYADFAIEESLRLSETDSIKYSKIGSGPSSRHVACANNFHSAIAPVWQRQYCIVVNSDITTDCCLHYNAVSMELDA
jgi:hypothetical protein